MQRELESHDGSALDTDFQSVRSLFTIIQLFSNICGFSPYSFLTGQITVTVHHVISSLLS